MQTDDHLMNNETLYFKNISRRNQYYIVIITVLAVSTICYIFSGLMGYRVTALILLLTVSLLAVSFDILPVLIAAALSAMIWDVFFIPPKFTFHVDNTEDGILLILSVRDDTSSRGRCASGARSTRSG